MPLCGVNSSNFQLSLTYSLFLSLENGSPKKFRFIIISCDLELIN